VGGGVGTGVGRVGGVGATGMEPPQATLRTTGDAHRRGIKAAKRLRARGTLWRGPRPRPGKFIGVLKTFYIEVHKGSVIYLSRRQVDDVGRSKTRCFNWMENGSRKGNWKERALWGAPVRELDPERVEP
jgi:hypothetical protein